MIYQFNWEHVACESGMFWVILGKKWIPQTEDPLVPVAEKEGILPLERSAGPWEVMQMLYHGECSRMMCSQNWCACNLLLLRMEVLCSTPFLGNDMYCQELWEKRGLQTWIEDRFWHNHTWSFAKWMSLHEFPDMHFLGSRMRNILDTNWLIDAYLGYELMHIMQVDISDTSMQVGISLVFTCLYKTWKQNHPKHLPWTVDELWTRTWTPWKNQPGSWSGAQPCSARSSVGRGFFLRPWSPVIYRD